jgi:hypothetical protein
VYGFGGVDCEGVSVNWKKGSFRLTIIVSVISSLAYMGFMNPLGLTDGEIVMEAVYLFILVWLLYFAIRFIVKGFIK